MKFAHQMTYAAPAPAVYAMLTDPKFQERRCAAGNPLESSSSVDRADDGGATIHLMRLLSVNLPGMLQKLAGDKIRLTETQTWAGGPADADRRDGTLEVRIHGQSGGVDGRLTMQGTGSQTTIGLEADIKINVPLVGGKIENYVAEMLGKFLAKDEELGTAWLKGEIQA
jgi:hypothetical protein